MSDITHARVNSLDQQSRSSFYANQSGPGSGKEDVGIWVEVAIWIYYCYKSSMRFGWVGKRPMDPVRDRADMQASFPGLGRNSFIEAGIQEIG